MGLTNRREEILKEMPAIKSSVTKSKNGKFIIQKTTITTVKPKEYFEAILENRATD